MARNHLPWLAWGAVLTLGTAAAHAQQPSAPPGAGAGGAVPETVSVEAGGRVFTESLRLSTTRFSHALRFGAIKRGSEVLDLNGRTLLRGKDFEIDYPSGTIYLKTPVQDGQILRVSYRYDEEKGRAGTYGMAGTGAQNGFNGFKFDFAPGASAFLGLGLTERLGDGTVLSSNVYGLSNSFSFGPGKLSGILMLGQRERADSVDMMTGAQAGSSVEEGQGRALIQNLEAKFLGGTVSARYQDIDSRFGGFQALSAAGFTSEQIGQLSRERGLKRTSFQFANIGSSSANFSQGLQQVGDNNGTITRRTGGAQLGGLKLNWWSQKVDEGFLRFQDIGAADWQQLAKERGLLREGVEGGVVLGDKKQMGFSALKLDSASGGIARSSFTAVWPSWKFDFSEQRVDPGFARFGDLRGDEFNPGQMAQEQGMLRRSMGVQADLGKNNKIAARQAVVRTKADDFTSLDLNASLGRLNIDHSLRSVGAGFNRLGNLGGPDIGAHMAAMLNMTEKGLQPQGHDAGGFFASQGIERSSLRGGYDFGKSLKASFEQVSIKGKDDSLKAGQVRIESKNVNLRVRQQKTGDKFTEVSRLMASEQQRLGATAGFTKTDFDADIKLGGAKQLTINQLKAGDAQGALNRTTASFNDKGFSASFAKRDVDASMPSLNSLADPERDLFRSLAGYSTEQSTLRWNSLRGLTVEADQWRWGQKDGTLGRDMSRAFVRWAMDSRTQFEGLLTEHRFGTADASQINQRNERFQLSRGFDRLGRITLWQNKQEFDGDQENLPDSITRALSVEAQLGKGAGFRTEQAETRFENGERETRTTNVLSTDLGKRAGISVSQTNVKRDGDKPDEVHRNYGLSYDFGKGFKVNYGFTRALTGEQGGLDKTVSVTPGTVQDVKVDAASYQQIRQDDQRDQHIGRVSISNAKPLQWGWINDVRFYYNADTYRDRWAWQRENRSLGFGATRGALAFGFDYNSQVAPTGERGIDRFFTFTTDRTGKGSLVATLRYGVRTLPDDREVMIRDYNLSWKPTENLVLNHSMVTNPLAPQNGVLLGTLPQPLRTNTWSLNYTREKDFKAGLFWKENQDENRLLRTREGGIDLLFRASNASPIRLTYGVHQTDQGQGRMTAHKFGLYFNQRPGPNQSWTLMLENLNWQHGRPSGSTLQNWNARLDYSWRF